MIISTTPGSKLGTVTINREIPSTLATLEIQQVDQISIVLILREISLFNLSVTHVFTDPITLGVRCAHT